MEWTLLIIVLIVGYFIYKTIQQNNPAAKIERLEGLAEQFYPEVAKNAEKSVENWQKQLSSLKKITTKDGKTREVTFTGQTKEELMKLIENTEKRLKEVKDFKHNYLRLKEKNKHESNEEKLALAQDYFDYFYTRTQINNQFKRLDYVAGDEDDSIFETMEELNIKVEEIVKRLNKQVAS